MAKYSENQQKALRLEAKKELIRLENVSKDTETMTLIESFKTKYNICETVYKVVLREHQSIKKNEHETHLKVTMRQVPHALKFAGYGFKKDLLNNIFGASCENGMTVKKLRDKVTHGMDSKAIEEIKQRKDELFGYMDIFIEVMKNFDGD